MAGLMATEAVDAAVTIASAVFCLIATVYLTLAYYRRLDEKRIRERVRQLDREAADGTDPSFWDEFTCHRCGKLCDPKAGGRVNYTLSKDGAVEKDLALCPPCLYRTVASKRAK